MVLLRIVEICRPSVVDAKKLDFIPILKQVVRNPRNSTLAGPGNVIAPALPGPVTYLV